MGIIEGELINFAKCMFFLVFVIFYQYEIFKRSKDKTDNRELFLLHVIVPLVFLIPVFLFVPSIPGVIVIGLVSVIEYYWLDRTEQWLRIKMRCVGAHDVGFKFVNHDKESDVVNIYKLRHQEPNTVAHLVKNNLEIVRKMTKTNIFANIIDSYLFMHPEIDLEDIRDGVKIETGNGDRNYILLKNEIDELKVRMDEVKDQTDKISKKPSKKGKNNKPANNNKNKIIEPIKEIRDLKEGEDPEEPEETIDPEDPEETIDPEEPEETIDQDEEDAIKIFELAFRDFYFHRVFMSFDFFEIGLTEDGEEEEEITTMLQVLILSLHESLIYDLTLTAAFLTPEVVKGKKFTTIFAIEGISDNEIAQKLHAAVDDLELFKEVPYFTKSRRLLKEVDTLERLLEEEQEEYGKLLNRKLKVSASSEKASRFSNGSRTNSRKDRRRRWFNNDDEEEE